MLFLFVSPDSKTDKSIEQNDNTQTIGIRNASQKKNQFTFKVT